VYRSTEFVTRFKNFANSQDLLQHARNEIGTPRVSGLVNDVLLMHLPAFYPDQRIRLRLPLDSTSPNSPGFALSTSLGLPERDRAFVERFLDENGLQIALFPAIQACCSTLEFFSGLWNGNLGDPNTSPSLPGRRIPFCEFANRYLGYDRGKSKLILLIFRHKVAHLSMPGVIHTLKKPISLFQSGRRVRISKGQTVTWAAYFGHHDRHLDFQHDKVIRRTKPGMSKIYTSKYKFRVDISAFVRDIFIGVMGPQGYLVELEKSRRLQFRFDSAISHIYGQR
jgi:hypothetical protein